MENCHAFLSAISAECEVIYDPITWKRCAVSSVVATSTIEGEAPG